MNPERRAIDWEGARARLRQSQRALDEALTAGPKRLEAVYRERAAQLAARGLQTSVPAAGLKVLTFALGAEHFALEFADLVELLPLAGFTPVPGGPPELLGVINVRGEIRSVIDLARVLGLAPGEAGAPGYVLLVRKHGRDACLRVDRPDRVHTLAPGALGLVAEGERAGVSRFLAGVGPDRLKVLSTEALLAHDIFRAGAARPGPGGPAVAPAPEGG